jgi:hypothetical protein
VPPCTILVPFRTSARWNFHWTGNLLSIFFSKERLCVREKKGFAFHLWLVFATCTQAMVLLFMQVETTRLTEALSCTSQDFLRLELSNCGLTTPDFTQICTNLSRINILELNLGGNPINLEVQFSTLICFGNIYPHISVAMICCVTLYYAGM